MKQWSNTFSFILATTGAAVGLGNIWQFPALVSQGGWLFILLYLCCVLIIGLPMMLAELLLGQSSQSNAINGMQKLCQQSQCSHKWTWISYWGLATLFFIVAFYSVVSGWSLHYIYLTLTQQLNIQDPLESWSLLNHSPHLKLIGLTIFLALTTWVITQELQRGIEWISNRVMPCFFFILMTISCLVIYQQGISPIWHQLNQINSPPFFQTLHIALGQALFSLAVGAGCLFTYGAYVTQKKPITTATFIIILLNVSVGLMSTMTLFSVSGLSVGQGGHSLMFVALPKALAGIAYHNIILLSFFVLLFFAAWTSAISLLEPIVLTLSQKCGLQRKHTAIILGLLAWLLGAICCFNENIFTLIRILSTDYMLPLGALGYIIFTGWRFKRSLIQHQTPFLNFIFGIIRFCVPPIMILIIIINSMRSFS